MRLIKDVFRVFYKSKVLMGIVAFSFVFSGIFVFRYYGKTSIGMVVAQLQQALKLSQYLFAMIVFVSYEYMKRFRAAGMDEASGVSLFGRKQMHLLAAYLLLTVWAMLFTVFLSACVIFSYSYYDIQDVGWEYIVHIVKNMLLNIFLIMELGGLIGLCLSHFQNRIIAYTTMIIVNYLVSLYPERLADQISVASEGKTPIYYFVEIFNIMPLVNTNYAPNYSFGESLLPYRIALILFWCAVLVTGMLFSVRSLRKWTILAVLMSCICISIYVKPASKVIMNSNPENTLAHDQYYYLIQNGIQKSEEADYNISKYKMELSIGFQMEATVTMSVDKSLPCYRMTLYHGYKVKKAWGDGKQRLAVQQEGDYVTVVNNTGKDITQIHLSYAGYSPAYYSNGQGIFLPGYFAYYPRAGFLPLFDDMVWDISECFVDENTEFAVKLNTNQKLYTNLPRKGEWYVGKCDGFTVVSGFYIEKKLNNGNRIVYPYLYGIAVIDEENSEEAAMKAYYNMIEESLDIMEKKNTIVFCVPNVNQLVNQHNGKRQIITRSMAI